MRKKVELKQEETNLSLSKLIPIYGKTKASLDEYKKAADLQNKRIKEIMRKKGLDSETADGWTATYSVRTSESFNQDALLEFVKSHKEFTDCVKTKEYVDEDTLANILYTGKVPKKLVLELDKFRTQKETEVLTIKKAKEEE